LRPQAGEYSTQGVQ